MSTTAADDLLTLRVERACVAELSRLVVEHVTRVPRRPPAPPDVVEHLRHAHGRSTLDLVGDDRSLFAIHWFEHVEASLDLVDVNHSH
jgi:hypothetical protein